MKLIFRPLARFVFGLAMILVAGVSASAEELWQILERRSTPNPEIVSVLQALPGPAVRGEYPFLLIIVWGYRALPNGLPTDEALSDARALYAGLDAIVAGTGLHAMTRTGGGRRTMYYYVRDVAPLRDAIRDFFDAQPPLSVVVSTREEADWDTVREVLDAIRK